MSVCVGVLGGECESARRNVRVMVRCPVGGSCCIEPAISALRYEERVEEEAGLWAPSAKSRSSEGLSYPARYPAGKESVWRDSLPGQLAYLMP